MKISRRNLIIGSGAVLGACGNQPTLGYEFESEGLGPVDLNYSLWETLPEFFDNPAARWEGDSMQFVGEPIVLTAKALVTPAADGLPNLASLTNPYQTPMELLEVRFSVYPVNTGAFTKLTGQGLTVKGDLGKIAVVDAGVPISGFGSYRDTSYACNTGSFVRLGSVNNSVSNYTWRLKYPLYIPGGTTLNLKFSSTSQAPVDAQVYVTYHCRVMKRTYRPKRLIVPWVTSFNSKAFEISATATTDDGAASSELDLVNPFGVDLEIARLIGSFTTIYQAGASGGALPLEVENLAQSWVYTYLNMRSSQGDDLVFTETPFAALWPAAWRSWDLPDGVLLNPGEWLKLTLRRLALDYDPGNDTGVCSFSVSLVGYREIGGAEFGTAASGG